MGGAWRRVALVVGCAVSAVGVAVFIGIGFTTSETGPPASGAIDGFDRLGVDQVGSTGSIPLPAVTLDPSSPAGRVILARIEEVRTSPQSAPAWYRLGLAYAAGNDAELARACFERATELHPDAPRPLYHLALLAEHSGELDAAISAMSKVVALAPEYLPARIRLGEWLIERDELDAAAESFDSARRLDANVTHATVGLARVALRRARPEDAEALLAPLCAPELASHADPAVHRTRAAALRDLGRHEDAMATLAVARRPETLLPDPWRAEIDLFRVDLSARMDHAEALVRSGRTDQAIALLVAMRRESPESVGVLCNLAVARRVGGDFDGATALLETELRRVPHSWQLHYNIALNRFLLLKRDQEGTLDGTQGSGVWDPVLPGERLANIVPHADAAIRLNPAFAPSLALRAELHLSVGDAGQAGEYFRRAAIAEPSNPDWLVRQGRAEHADGRAEVAVRTLRRAVAAAPGSAGAIDALAEALTASGRRDEALKLRRDAGIQSPPGGLTSGEWRR